MEPMQHDHGHEGHSTANPASGSGAPSAPERGRDHASMGHGGMHTMQSDVTRPQLVAVTLLTVLALVASLLWSASYANLTIGSHDVGRAVMPPGMIMPRDMPGEAMRDMAAVDPRTVGYAAPPGTRGDQLLEPRLEDGVKVFDLEAAVIKWHILPDVEVMAYALNRQIPGPRLRVTEGDRVRINVTNRLPESTTIHWHGLILPNAMDGPAEITQEPIAPGASYSYEFTTRQGVVELCGGGEAGGDAEHTRSGGVASGGHHRADSSAVSASQIRAMGDTSRACTRDACSG
jgi:manganese oxidase